MMYPIMTLNDNTEITHSEMKPDGKVKVYIEKPAFGGFHSAVCWLPDYRWEDIDGFDKKEIAEYQELIESLAHLIIRFSQEGGFSSASNF